MASVKIKSTPTGGKRKSLHQFQSDERNNVANLLTRGIKFGSTSYRGKKLTSPGVFKGAEPSSRQGPLFPGDDGEDGGALPYEGSVADSEESDQDEAKAQREEILAHARKAKLEIEKTVVPVPGHIAFISQGLCHIFRHAWTEGRVEGAENAINEANAKIRELNKSESRRKDAFTVPGENILQHIHLTRECISEWTALKYGNPERTSQLKAVAKNVAGLLINILPQLVQCGISYKSIVSGDVSDLIGRILNDSKLKTAAHAKLIKYLEQDFALPTSYQVNIASSAQESISELFRLAGDGKVDQAKNTLPRLGEVNQRLTSFNSEFGFDNEDHILPIQYLPEMLNNQKLQDDQNRGPVLEVLKDQFAHMLFTIGYSELGNTLSSQKKAEGTKLPSTVEEDLERQLKSFQTPLTEDARTHMEELAEPPSQKKCSLKKSVPRPLAYSAEDITVGVPGPYITTDGKTQWGQIIHVQPLGFGCRVTFNRGSSKCPVFDMRPGSCLPRGMAAEFAKEAKLPKHKNRAPSEIKLITDIVQLVNGNITRFRVLWRKEPKVTFPTRSELSAIVGKQMVDGPNGIREQLEAKRNKLIEWHEVCQMRGWHPDFRPPYMRLATPEEKASLPWIFGAPDLDESESDEGENDEENEHEADLVEEEEEEEPDGGSPMSE